MKILFSRKGFDSQFGGAPSPIFLDGRMLSLPIPDKHSPVRYADIMWNGNSIGTMVAALTRGRIPADYKAHLDPDLNSASVPRHPDWRPLLGQNGAAQGHIRNHGVGPGDLFMFYGLFRDVTGDRNAPVYCRTSPARHVIWGWLQIEKIVKVDECDRNEYAWASRHPHMNRTKDDLNTLYLAGKTLNMPCSTYGRCPGAGVFPRFAPELQLTAPGAERTSLWQLPDWIFPGKGRKPLTYHTDLSRWHRRNEHVQLQTVPRGQEFILDCDDYPEAPNWILELCGNVR